jgi:thiamine transporter ThiT
MNSRSQVAAMIARGIIGFVLGAAFGAATALYSLGSTIESVAYRGGMCGIVLALLLASSSRLFGWFEKLMKFFR